MSAADITRRAVIAAGFGGAGALIWNANSLTLSPSFAHVFRAVEDWTRVSQRTLLLPGQLAKEYSRGGHIAGLQGEWHLRSRRRRIQCSGRAELRELAAADRRHGLSSLIALRRRDTRLPSRTQITRHDCVEGWSAIGMWTGVQLGLLLKAAGLSPSARYAVFHCADNLTGEPSKGGEQSPGQYYESIDLVDAFHPQTLIAYALNGRPLDVAHGAPLRLRVERQLGYKQAKYIERIEITDSFANIAGGRGGYWEDRGYEWYAGV